MDKHIYIYIYIHVCEHIVGECFVHMCACTCVCEYIVGVHICIYGEYLVGVHICTYIYVCVSIYMCVYSIYIYMCV